MKHVLTTVALMCLTSSIAQAQESNEHITLNNITGNAQEDRVIVTAKPHIATLRIHISESIFKYCGGTAVLEPQALSRGIKDTVLYTAGHCLLDDYGNEYEFIALDVIFPTMKKVFTLSRKEALEGLVKAHYKIHGPNNYYDWAIIDLPDDQSIQTVFVHDEHYVGPVIREGSTRAVQGEYHVTMVFTRSECESYIREDTPSSDINITCALASGMSGGGVFHPVTSDLLAVVSGAKPTNGRAYAATTNSFGKKYIYDQEQERRKKRLVSINYEPRQVMVAEAEPSSWCSPDQQVSLLATGLSQNQVWDICR